MRQFFAATATALTLALTAACADNAQQDPTPTQPEQSGEVVAEIIKAPAGLHFFYLNCLGKCRVTVERENGTTAARWYVDEGELKTDWHTLFDELVVQGSRSFVSVTGGETVTVELLSPPEEYTAGPVVVLQSMNDWFEFAFFTDGGELRTTEYVGIPWSTAGAIFAYTVVDR